MTLLRLPLYLFFFFNDTATTEIYTLSLHDALPISQRRLDSSSSCSPHSCFASAIHGPIGAGAHVQLRNRSFPMEVILRSEEHTSELQLQSNLVCRLLLEKKKHGLAIRSRPGSAREI